MKNTNSILLFLFVFFTTSVLASKKTEVVNFENGKPKYEKTQLSGQLIKLVSYFPNGQVQEIGHYKNGKRHGSFVNFTENGMKISSAFFFADKKDGLWTFYNDEGILTKQVFFNKNQIIRLDNNGMAENSEF